MVWSPGTVSTEFGDVPQRHCFPMLLSIFKHTLGQVHKSQISTVTIFFCINIKFDKLLSEIDHDFYKKGEFKLTKSA